MTQNFFRLSARAHTRTGKSIYRRDEGFSSPCLSWKQNENGNQIRWRNRGFVIFPRSRTWKNKYKKILLADTLKEQRPTDVKKSRANG